MSTIVLENKIFDMIMASSLPASRLKSLANRIAEAASAKSVSNARRCQLDRAIEEAEKGMLIEAESAKDVIRLCLE